MGFQPVCMALKLPLSAQDQIPGVRSRIDQTDLLKPVQHVLKCRLILQRPISILSKNLIRILKLLDPSF